MGKIVKESHQVGEKGVILFNSYCNQHSPFIIFREVTKHDFGIDGEVELTRKNSDGKTEAVGEILKIQIKSVNSDNSYIKNENDDSFTYYASVDDIDYWVKHHKYGLPVVVVIVDLRNNGEIIYAKKITDQFMPKSSKKVQTVPIQFSKKDNKLEFGKNEFIERFTSEFKSRISYDIEETLISNALVVKKFPKNLYVYKSKFKTKKSIFEKIKQADAPHFVVKAELIYTFRDIKDCKTFCKDVLADETPSIINFQKIKESLDNTNIYLELFYEHLKHDLYGKQLSFNKDYHRYYFRLKDTEDFLEVDTKTRKRDADAKKKVVTYHEYGRTKKIVFFRHLAVDFRIKLVEDGFWIIINPKYLFTIDRKEPLPPKLITRYTNFLTAREFNDVYLNSLHFWKTYLFKGAKDWEIFANEKANIVIGDYHDTKVGFGIPLDAKKERKAAVIEADAVNQQSLFGDED